MVDLCNAYGSRRKAEFLTSFRMPKYGNDDDNAVWQSVMHTELSFDPALNLEYSACVK